MRRRSAFARSFAGVAMVDADGPAQALSSAAAHTNPHTRHIPTPVARSRRSPHHKFGLRRPLL